MCVYLILHKDGSINAQKRSKGYDYPNFQDSGLKTKQKKKSYFLSFKMLNIVSSSTKTCIHFKARKTLHT